MIVSLICVHFYFSGSLFFVLLALAYASADNCQTGDLKGDPTDCGSFFECVEGKWVKIECGQGLEWNEQAKVCDWPASANCKETSDAPTDAPTTIPPTEGPTAAPTEAPTDAPTEAPTGTPGPSECNCPAEDDPQHDVLCSNPNDCSSFYKCFEGHPSLIQCPPGQEWANSLERCDWPEIANCHEDN